MEFDSWGFNLATFSFVGTLVFSVLGFFSLLSQNRRIWRLKSGLSVPVITFMYMLASFTAGALYGLADGRFALVFHGILRIPLCIAILFGLKRFRGFTKIEMALGVVLAVVVALMCFADRKDLFFLGFMIGLVPKSLIQPWEIWKNKNSGAIDPATLWVFVLSAIFWMLYWWSSGGPLMFSLNVILFGIALLTLILYYRYRPLTDSSEP